MSFENINITIAYATIIGDSTTNEISLYNLDKKYNICNNKKCRYIENLSLAVFINAISNPKSPCEEKACKKILFFDKKYTVRLRLTEESSGKYTDLGEFMICPKDTKKICLEGYEIFKHTRLCFFENIKLLTKRANESYIIKVLVRLSNENTDTQNEWIIQSVYPLYLNENSN